ncbi:MAG TPA: hypothetical protein PLE79_08260, partial [Clostridia bacterium]|nr:hypothetical protein [Clostridia bacterium]
HIVLIRGVKYMLKHIDARRDCRKLLYEIAIGAQQASALLGEGLKGTQIPEARIVACRENVVRSRRRLFAYLQRAFITPIDREDIYLLGQDAANAAQAACSACALLSISIHQSTAMMGAAAADCLRKLVALHEAFLERSETPVIQTACDALRRRAWESAMLYRQLQKQKTARSGLELDALLAVCDVCARAADRMEYVLIKNN